MPVPRPGYVCFSAQDWWYHNRAHSDFQLMRRVAEERTVLLVNSIGMRMPRPGRSTMVVRRIARKAGSVARLVRRPLPDVPGFHVFTPLIVPFYGSPSWRARNARLVRAQVGAVARHLGIDEPVVVVTIPTAWEVVDGISRRALVFNRSDKHSAFSETDQPYVRRLEDDLLRRADRVLYVSRSLMAAEADLTGARSVFLDHGVDLDHFRRRPIDDEPDDLRSVPRPRVGFFGGFDDYVVDFDLLEKIARELPEAQLVLVGDATCSMRRFEALPNVHWLGYRPYEEIPRYGSAFDVALMPWLDNDWIRHSNPVKLKEYLALGLPVVSTDFPEVRHYADWVSIASDADDFVARVRKALGEREQAGDVDPGERRAAVAGASWEARAQRLVEICEGTEPA